MWGIKSARGKRTVFLAELKKEKKNCIYLFFFYLYSSSCQRHRLLGNYFTEVLNLWNLQTSHIFALICKQFDWKSWNTCSQRQQLRVMPVSLNGTADESLNEAHLPRLNHWKQFCGIFYCFISPTEGFPQHFARCDSQCNCNKTWHTWKSSWNCISRWDCEDFGRIPIPLNPKSQP